MSDKSPPRSAEEVARRMAKSRGRGRVRPEDIVEGFVEEAGGPASFSKMLWQDYQAARVRSPVAAQRIMASVMALWAKAQENGRTGAPVSEEDIRRRMAEIATTLGVANAAEQAGPAAPAQADDQTAADQDPAAPLPAPADHPQEPAPAPGPDSVPPPA